jgi:MFS transporter, OFA family, oxalate/formate antiporter
MAEASTVQAVDRLALTRWIQLFLGVVCMVAIANLQYGWTLFVNPIDQMHGWGVTAIQLTFTIAITTETFLVVPLGGRLVDRFGPKLACISGPLVAIAWYLNSIADSLYLFYFAAVISGIGAGLVFASSNGNALRWFPDRRGLAIGLTAAGFAGGGVLTAAPLDGVIKTYGYQAAYFWFGLGQGFVVLLTGMLLRAPRPTEVAALSPPRVPQGKHNYAPRDVWRSAPFWLMYAMFVLVGAGGLVLQAQLAPIAADFAINALPVTLLGITLLTPIFAVSIGQIMNGLSRPVFGWVSDWIGRERTMVVAFLLGAFAFSALILFGNIPVWFVLLTGLALFAWGQIFALFPAICTDIYGSRFATANYGILYTAKGVASWFVPWASALSAVKGWTAVFAVLLTFNAIAAALVFVLKRARNNLPAKDT